MILGKQVLCYQLRVHIVDSKPEIWRRILVPAEATLYDLHGILQTAFGWEARHLYQFSTGNGRYSEVIYPDFEDFDFDDPEDCERRAMEHTGCMRDARAL